MALNLFPARAPIGRATVNGQQYDVLMTVEFSRALADLLERVGGDAALGNDDITNTLAQLEARPAPDAPDVQESMALVIEQMSGELSALRQELQSLQAQIQPSANLNNWRDMVDQVVATPQLPADWERPGRIGFKKPNSGVFTTLQANGAANFSPANAAVTIKPTGTGIVDIQPATVGAMNRMNVGAVVPGTGAFTTLTASAAVDFSPAGAAVTIKPTGTGIVDIQPATAGALNNMNIGAAVPGTGKFSNLTAVTTITSTASKFFGSATLVVNALATPVTFVGIDAQPGILRIRDSTLGGSALWLIDPNGGAQLIGVNQIAGLTVVNGGAGLGFAWQANIASGAVPRTLSWTFYG